MCDAITKNLKFCFVLLLLGRSCGQNGRRYSAFKILTGTPAGKLPLGRRRRRWEEHIRMNLKEKGINTRNWIDSSQDRDYWRSLVNTVLNLRVPWS